MKYFRRCNSRRDVHEKDELQRLLAQEPLPELRRSGPPLCPPRQHLQGQGPRPRPERLESSAARPRSNVYNLRGFAASWLPSAQYVPSRRFRLIVVDSCMLKHMNTVIKKKLFSRWRIFIDFVYLNLSFFYHQQKKFWLVFC